MLAAAKSITRPATTRPVPLEPDWLGAIDRPALTSVGRAFGVLVTSVGRALLDELDELLDSLDELLLDDELDELLLELLDSLDELLLELLDDELDDSLDELLLDDELDELLLELLDDELASCCWSCSTHWTSCCSTTSWTSCCWSSLDDELDELLEEDSSPWQKMMCEIPLSPSRPPGS